MPVSLETNDDFPPNSWKDFCLEDPEIIASTKGKDMPKRNTLAVYFLFFLIFSMLLPACGRDTEKKGAISSNPPAPDFTLQDLKGKTWKLSDLKGKVVFINFWATWCPPCRDEMPSMQKLYTEMADTPFQMLAVLTNDDPMAAERFARQHGFTFPILIDRKGNIGGLYGITGVPETFIVDPGGILRRKYIGPFEWDSTVAKDMIKEYFPKIQ